MIDNTIRLWLASTTTGKFLPRERYHTAQTAKWFQDTIGYLEKAEQVAKKKKSKSVEILQLLVKELKGVRELAEQPTASPTERKQELLYAWLMDQLLEIDIAKFIPTSTDYLNWSPSNLDSQPKKASQGKVTTTKLKATVKDGASKAMPNDESSVVKLPTNNRAENYLYNTITRCDDGKDYFVIIDKITNQFCAQLDKVRHSCWLYCKIVSTISTERKYDYCAPILNANMLVCRYVARVVLPVLVVEFAKEFRGLLAAIASETPCPNGILPNRRAVLELVHQSFAHISRMVIGVCPPGTDPELKTDVEESVRFALDNLMIARHQLRLASTSQDQETFQPAEEATKAIQNLRDLGLSTLVIWNPTAGGHKVPRRHPEQPSRVTAVAHLIKTSCTYTGEIRNGLPIVRPVESKKDEETELESNWRIQNFATVGVFEFHPQMFANSTKMPISAEELLCTHSLKYLKRLWRARQLLEQGRWEVHPACWPVLKPSDLAQDKLLSLEGDDGEVEDEDSASQIGTPSQPVSVLVDFDEDHHNDSNVPDRCCCCSASSATETQASIVAGESLASITHRGDGHEWNHDEEGRIRKHVQQWYKAAFGKSPKPQTNLHAATTPSSATKSDSTMKFGIDTTKSFVSKEGKTPASHVGPESFKRISNAVIKVAESGVKRDKLGSAESNSVGNVDELEVPQVPILEVTWITKVPGVFTLATVPASAVPGVNGPPSRRRNSHVQGISDVPLVSLDYVCALMSLMGLSEEKFLEAVGVPLELVTAYFVEISRESFISMSRPLPDIVEPARIAIVDWVQSVLDNAIACKNGQSTSVVQRDFVEYLDPVTNMKQECVQELVTREAALELVNKLRYAKTGNYAPQAPVLDVEVAIEFISEAVDVETTLLELYFLEVESRKQHQPLPEYVRSVGEQVVSWVLKSETAISQINVEQSGDDDSVSDEMANSLVAATTADARSVPESTATGAGASTTTYHASSRVRPQDTFVSEHSLDVAVNSLELIASAVDYVMLNEYLNFKSQVSSTSSQLNAFCVVRPPGHHVGRSGKTAKCYSHGFCLLNNVSFAISHARIRWGVRRVAVIDIDAHYGNGTAEILQHDEDALFASVHLHTPDSSSSNNFFASDLQGASLICPSTNFYSIGIGPQGRQKRGTRGRSNLASDMVAISIKPRSKRPGSSTTQGAPSTGPDTPRGRGRPPGSGKKKTDKASVAKVPKVKRPVGRPPGSGKRPVGRPPKVKRPVGRPPGSGKRPVGRPPGSLKRPVGRPPGSGNKAAKKTAVDAAEYAAYVSLNPDAVPVKRGPGRPRKVKPDELKVSKLKIESKVALEDGNNNHNGSNSETTLDAREVELGAAILALSQAGSQVPAEKTPDDPPQKRSRGRPRKRGRPPGSTTVRKVVVSQQQTPQEPVVNVISAPKQPMVPQPTVGELRSQGVVDETGLSRQCNCEKCLLLPPAEFASKQYYGGSGHREAIEEIVIPALKRFDPEMIFISAGFDGHWKDPLGGKLGMEEKHFHEETQLVTEFAQQSSTCRGRIVSVLEGGYDVVQKIKNRGSSKGFTGALADSAVAHVCALASVEYSKK